MSKLIQGRRSDRAVRAWSKVDSAIRHSGTYTDVVFDDPIIHRVLADMGGWIPLGTRKEDEWPFIATEFKNRYRSYRERGQAPQYPAVMVGIANAQNGMHGFATQPPVLIGNEKRATRVRAGGTSQPPTAQAAATRLSAGSSTPLKIWRAAVDSGANLLRSSRS